MTPFTSIPDHVERTVDAHDGASRRDFLKQSGLFVVSLATAPAFAALATDASAAQVAAQATRGPGPYPDLDFRQLDSWIVIREDETATFFVGKTDLGQGTGTAFRQIMADELDIPYDRTSCVMGVTNLTVDQGGSGGSDALQTDGWPMRRVAAEARRVLLDLASVRLGAPVAALSVAGGVVSLTADPTRRVTYGQLIGGRRFNVTLTGANVDATTGVARLKPVTGYPGNAEALLAMEKGEVHGTSGMSLGTIRTAKPDWLTGKVNLILQLALEPHPTLLKGVALALDLATEPVRKQALELVLSRQTMAYPVVAPPGVPPERVAALRAAFTATMKDAEFLADLERAGFEASPVSGEEIDALIKRVYAAPKEAIDHARSAVGTIK